MLLSISLVCCPYLATGVVELKTPGVALSFGAGTGITTLSFFIKEFLLIL